MNMITNRMMVISIIIGMISVANAQYYVNIQNNFGYTRVNVSNAMDIPEYSEITDEGLVEWDRFNYKGLLQVFKKKQGNLLIGGELGIHRLYYWEKKFYPSIYSSARWNWGTIWTAQAGGLVKGIIASQYYVMTGGSLHLFLNGTGVTIGFPFAVGHEIRITENVTIPAEFRIDIIFGKAIPMGLGGGAGVQYQIKL